MKRNDNGGFCILYVEPNDDKAELLQIISEQKKPVVIMLAEQSHVFQRPEDFVALKHVKRQLSVPIVFVIPNGGHVVQLASRNGFPVYPSMDALADALAAGQLARHRSASRPVSPPETTGRPLTPRRTVTLHAMEEEYPSRTGKGIPREAAERSPAAPEQSKIPERPFTPRRTVPLTSAANGHAPVQKKTEPLQPPSEKDISFRRTGPLPAMRPSSQVSPSPPPSLTKQGGSTIPRTLAALTIFALAIAAIGSFLVFYNNLPDMAATPAAATKVGRITFLSSGQLSENSSQGISDEVLVELDNVPAPAPQKSYYAWLLGDKNQSDMKTYFLGVLRVNNGRAQLLYPGDAKHTNLLLMTSRFLVTEENATVTPIGPSPDYNTWRYYGEISQEPIKGLENNAQHSSMLDHLRHLLASDPALDNIELPGGLNNWLYRNTSKVLEWTTSMREPWEDSKDIGFVRRQTTRVLEYLDGVTYVKQDLPPNTPLLTNERLARIGLLEVNGPTQDPPGYLTHIVQHLNGLLQAPGATSATRKLVAEIVTALNNAKYWLTQVRMNAKKIMQMSDAQLRQPATLTLINNMIDNANHAYGGEIDPSTGQRREAINWVHDHMQFLATLDVSTFTASSQSIQMIKDIKNVKA